MSLKNFLSRIWTAIANIFNKIESQTKVLIPIAVKVVQGLKIVMDSPVDDVLGAIIKNAIPGNADDNLIDKITTEVHKWIPKVLLELQLIDSIANIEDTNEQLKAVLAKLKLSSDEAQNIVYHGLAALILEKLSDGKLTWTDSTAIAEYYYKEILKKETV